MKVCFRIFLLLTLVTGFFYPISVSGMAQLLFVSKASGSPAKRNNLVVGSSLVGQPFQEDGYFWGRLSATDYAAGGATNLAPSSIALVERAEDRRRLAGVLGEVPVDLVTSSASGLDPHISPDSAELQVSRVAQARAVSPQSIRRLVQDQVERPWAGLLGPPRVNVLQLNIALDQEFPQ